MSGSKASPAASETAASVANLFISMKILRDVMVGGKVTPEAAYQSAGTSRRGDEQPGSPATMPAFVPNPARESPVPNATSTPENRVTDASPFRITRLRFVRAAVTLIWISAGAQPPLILFREPPS